MTEEQHMLRQALRARSKGKARMVLQTGLIFSILSFASMNLPQIINEPDQWSMHQWLNTSAGVLKIASCILLGICMGFFMWWHNERAIKYLKEEVTS